MWLVVLALLAVVDVVLIAALFAKPRDAAPTEHGPIPTFTPLPDPTESPVPSPSATGAVATDADAPIAFAAALNATQAWRATAGSCTSGTAVIEQTSDGGATWVPVDTSAFDPKTVLALTLDGGTLSVVGGAGEDCEVQQWSASVLARSATPPWVQAPGAPSMPYVTDESSTITLGGEAVQSPCVSPVRALATGEVDVVGCDTQLSSKTGSAAWVTIDAPGLVDLVTTSTGYLLAATQVDGCDGVAVQSVNAPLTIRSFPSIVGCAPAADLVPAGVALATSGDVVWLTSGQRTLVSQDGGVTW